MAELSQKELLNDGIGSVLKGAARAGKALAYAAQPDLQGDLQKTGIPAVWKAATGKTGGDSPKDKYYRDKIKDMERKLADQQGATTPVPGATPAATTSTTGTLAPPPQLVKKPPIPPPGTVPAATTPAPTTAPAPGTTPAPGTAPPATTAPPAPKTTPGPTAPAPGTTPPDIAAIAPGISQKEVTGASKEVVPDKSDAPPQPEAEPQVGPSTDIAGDGKPYSNNPVQEIAKTFNGQPWPVDEVDELYKADPDYWTTDKEWDQRAEAVGAPIYVDGDYPKWRQSVVDAELKAPGTAFPNQRAEDEARKNSPDFADHVINVKKGAISIEDLKQHVALIKGEQKDVGTAGEFGKTPKDVGTAGEFGVTPQAKQPLADSFSQKNLLRQLHMLAS